MRPDLELRDAIGMVMTGAEEYHIVIRAVLQLLTNQLYQLVLHITTGDAVTIHAGKLVLLIDHIVNRIREVRIVHPVQNDVNNKALPILALSLGLRHDAEGNQFDLLLRH